MGNDEINDRIKRIENGINSNDRSDTSPIVEGKLLNMDEFKKFDSELKDKTKFRQLVSMIVISIVLFWTLFSKLYMSIMSD